MPLKTSLSGVNCIVHIPFKKEAFKLFIVLLSILIWTILLIKSLVCQELLILEVCVCLLANSSRKIAQTQMLDVSELSIGDSGLNVLNYQNAPYKHIGNDFLLQKSKEIVLKTFKRYFFFQYHIGYVA